jgi:hypothetical protein
MTYLQTFDGVWKEKILERSLLAMRIKTDCIGLFLHLNQITASPSKFPQYKRRGRTRRYGNAPQLVSNDHHDAGDDKGDHQEGVKQGEVSYPCQTAGKGDIGGNENSEVGCPVFCHDKHFSLGGKKFGFEKDSKFGRMRLSRG